MGGGGGRGQGGGGARTAGTAPCSVRGPPAFSRDRAHAQTSGRRESTERVLQIPLHPEQRARHAQPQ